MKMQFNSKLFKAAAALAAIGAAGAVYLGAAPRPAPAPPARPPEAPGVVRFAPNAPQLAALKVAPVVALPLPVADAFNGRLVYDEDVTSRISSPVSGRVLALRAQAGDTVRRGALLAEIDAPELAAAEADWRKAQADQSRKAQALARAHILLDGEVLARKDLESAEADAHQADAELRRTALRMRSLNAGGDQQGRFGLRAPLDGVVAERQINPGQELRPDLPNALFVISDLHRLWLLVDVPEAGAARIHPGQSVTVDSDAWPGQRFSARVERVAPVLDAVTRRIQVRCALDNASGRLKPEMFVRAAFLADDGRQALALPNTALFAEGAHSYVFVESAPGVFAKRRVGIALRGREASFIDTGLRAGERVVTEGAFLLNAEVTSDAR